MSRLVVFGWCLFAALAQAADGGPVAAMTREEFLREHGPRLAGARVVQAALFREGRSDSEAIRLALASRATPDEALSVVLSGRDWVVDRAVEIPSNTEFIVDGCRLKLADGTFDNLIRVARLQPDPANPNGPCLSREPVHDVRILGRRGASLEGAGRPYVGVNPKTKVREPWVGDFFGWRTLTVLISAATRYEVGGLAIRKTHCWAVSQEQSQGAYIHDLEFETDVKNGDGVDFLNGCSFGWVEAIRGRTSDDTVAVGALDDTVLATNPRYIWPMQSMGYRAPGSPGMDVHDIAIRDVTTRGKHHGVICLASSPKVYNILIEGIREAAPSEREAVVKVYTGYGKATAPGNLSNIVVRDVESLGARYAVMVKASVKDVAISDVRQRKPGGELTSFSGDSPTLQFREGK